MLFRPAVSPYAFKGGPLSDYVVDVGEAGTHFTRHIPTNKAVQSTTPGGVSMNPAGIGNLVVGALNLGVGIYNAVQIKRVQRQVGELRQELAAGFASVEVMLDQQARTLEILLKQNRAIAEALQILRAEMHDGFRAVAAQFHQQEADAFHRLTLELLTIWRRVGEEMLVDAVAPDELSRLIAAADKLDSWARVSSSKIPAGHPARQPFLVARALGLRAVADAKLLQNEKIGRAAEERVREFVGEVEGEARALCSNQTTYFLAAEAPEILAQYAYLRRGLRLAGEMSAASVSGESRPLPWADYLERVANVMVEASDKEKSVGGRERVPLRTLRDFEWYLELLGEPRDSALDLHARDAVSLKELFEVVGAPPTTKLLATAIPGLKELALPEFRKNLAAAISSEFGWGEPLSLAASLPDKALPPGPPQAPPPYSSDRTRCARCERQYPAWKRYCEDCEVAL